MQRLGHSELQKQDFTNLNGNRTSQGPMAISSMPIAALSSATDVLSRPAMAALSRPARLRREGPTLRSSSWRLDPLLRRISNLSRAAGHALDRGRPQWQVYQSQSNGRFRQEEFNNAFISGGPIRYCAASNLSTDSRTKPSQLLFYQGRL